jgi:hypothetical protein
MRTLSLTTFFCAALALAVLAGCSPKFNWRDYSSTDAPYRAMFPDKPSSHTRAIDVGGMKVDMTMTAVDIDGTTFAIGSAQAPDAAQAIAALPAMKTALINNIGASIKTEKSGANTIDIDATGTRAGVPMRLVGHFEARDKRFYQVIVMGPADQLSKDNVDMFLTSFKHQ